MKLIWHIIKKDIRRDRLALLLWAAMFVAQVGIGLTLLSDPGDDRGRLEVMQVASGGLAFMQFLVGYMLVARLVQADMLFGTDMFWATRPISRRRLLLAKAGAAVLVFALLPVALKAPWWLWCGFTARDFFWMGAETVGWQLIVIAPAFLIASLTNEFGRVLLWTILLLVGVFLTVALVARVYTVNPDVVDPLEVHASNAHSRIWLAAVLVTVFSAAVVAHQYLTQRLARSIGLVVLSLVIVVAVGLFAPVNLSRELADLPLPPTEPGAAAALDAVKAEVGLGLPDNRRKRRSEIEESLATEIYFHGQPDSWSVRSGVGRQSWSWADGKRVTRSGFVDGSRLHSEELVHQIHPRPSPAADPETTAWFKAKHEEELARQRTRGLTAPAQTRMVPPSKPGARNFVYSMVPEALSKRALADAPAYEAVLSCVVTRPVLLTELPFRVGAQGGRDSTRAHLMQVTRSRVVERKEPERVERDVTFASLLITTPSVRVNGLWQVANFVREVRNSMQGEIWTVNHSTGEIYCNNGYSLQSTRTALVAGVTLSWTQWQVRQGQIIRDGKTVLRDPQWEEHTSVVLVAEEFVTRFDTRVKADRLEFRPSLWETRPQATTD